MPKDTRLMIHCQGIKIYIPDNFQPYILLNLCQILKKVMMRRFPSDEEHLFIKILRYDSNGFILASKKLLENMKFQWPRKQEEVKEISFQLVEWLFQGLEIEQKRLSMK